MTPRSKVARCKGANRLVPNWDKTDAYRAAERGIPDGCYQCPPCRRCEAQQWLVTAGHNISVVTAGCEQAAKEAMHAEIYGPRRRHWNPGEVQRITARPATADDVARFEQMRLEMEQPATTAAADRPEGEQ